MTVHLTYFSRCWKTISRDIKDNASLAVTYLVKPKMREVRDPQWQQVLETPAHVCALTLVTRCASRHPTMYHTVTLCNAWFTIKYCISLSV